MDQNEACKLLRRGKDSTEEWNRFRQDGGQVPSLAGVSLRKLSLEGFDLCGVDFSGANLCNSALTNADLRGANLAKANLSGSNLREADLTGALLNEAIFTKADLSQADLSEANAARVDFVGAIIKGTCFHGTDLSKANLSKRDLTGLDFSNAILCNADLRGANLGGACLRNADLKAGNLTQTSLRKADLTEVDLRGACCDGADLGNTKLERAQIDRATFAEANLSAADLTHVRGASRAVHLDTVLLDEDNPVKYFETCERTWSDRYLSWEIIRTLGNIKLFAVSYPLLAFLMAAFYLGGLYNEKVEIARAWADSVIESANDGDESEVPAPAAVLLAEQVKCSEPFLFPWTTVVLFASTIVLVVASSIYTVFCPAEVKEFSRLHWMHQLNRSLVPYWALAWKHRRLRWVCGVSYALGGSAFVLVVSCKLLRALYYVWKYGNIFPLG